MFLTGVLVMWELEDRVKEFFAFMTLLVTGVFGVFVSLDLFFFLFFYEVAVLPMYLLIAIWGSTRKEYGAMKLTLYLLAGTALVVPAVLALYVTSDPHTFDMTRLAATAFSPRFQVIVFPFLFLGFGVLAGLWPFHTWSPVGHVAAPTAVSMLHAGVLMKLGAYGILRVGMLILPAGAALLGALDRDPRHDQHRLRGVRGAGADRPQVRDRVFVGVAHGDRAAWPGDALGGRHQRRRLPDVQPRHHDCPLLRRGRLHLRSLPHPRDREAGRPVARWSPSRRRSSSWRR